MAYPTLLWFAGYSNVSSVAIVIICFIIMAIFITLVSMNVDLSRTPQSLPGVEQRNMVKVVNPFFLQLGNQGEYLKDGLNFHISRLCPCKAVVLWGVKISTFHDVILKTGHEIRRKLLSENPSETLDLDPLHKEKFQFLTPGDNDVSIPCPATVNSSMLGNIPRQRYPVAVFVFVPECPERACPDEEGDSECSNNIVGLFSVIHLKDEIVTQSSHVIQQYIKTAGIPIYSLKPLFVNTPSEGHFPERGGISHDDERQNELDAQVGPHCDDANRRPTGACENTSFTDAHSCSSDKHSSQASFSVCLTGTDSEADRSSISELAELRQYSSEAESSDIGIRRRRQPLSSHESTDRKSSPSAGAQSNERVEGASLIHDSDDSDKQLNTEKSRSAECVVCQARKVMCVLLPCRHACVCYSCFKLLDRCPMCRGALESYFILSGNDGDETASSEEDTDEDNEVIHNIEQRAVNASFAEMWERLNMRLNAFLGFR